jgi:hypothetical protein
MAAATIPIQMIVIAIRHPPFQISLVLLEKTDIIEKKHTAAERR